MRAVIYLTTLLLLAPLALLAPAPLSPVAPAAAQGTPQYADASSGLPTADLWVAKTSFFDLDEDGVGDLFALGPRKGVGDRSLHIFKWSGSSWSNQSASEGTDNIPHSSYGGYDFGDLDNDGDWDVGVGSHGADRMDAYLRSFGTTWLRSSAGLQASEDAWSVDVGDFNNDGNLDLVVAGFWEFDLHAYSGDGRGNWVDRSNGLGTARTHSAALFCDVNNDGNLDLVSTVGEQLDGVVEWVYRGDGAGNWYNYSNGLPNSGYGLGVGCGDFNNDGLADLALALSDGSLRAYLGDGAGNWSESSTGLLALGYSDLELVDLNNDKYDDLVAMEPSDPGRVHVYLRNATGQSWTHLTQELSGNAKGYRVGAGDFDHNGHPDLAAGFGTDDVAGYPGSVKVWRETSTPSALGVTLTYPDGKEYFKAGAVTFVRWLSAVPEGTGTRTVKLELSTSGVTGPWTTVADNLPDTGLYQWTVPDEQSGEAYLRVTLTESGGGSASDTNDNAFGIEQSSGGGGGDREPHEPIVIGSDAEWTPANGVRNGSGTEADPYLIERWDITCGDQNCISISNTRAYALIRDNYLHDSTGLYKGVVLRDAENLTVAENDITRVHHGINLGDTEVLIQDNHLYDIEARGVMAGGSTNRLTAIGNTIENPGAWGFKLSSVTGFGDTGEWRYPALLENNTISGAYEAIALIAAQGTFRGNLLTNNGVGISASMGTSWSKAMNSLFEANTIVNNRHGVEISYAHELYGQNSSSATFRSNLIEANLYRGLWLHNNADYIVQNNTLAFNTLGVESNAFGNQTFANNTFSFNLGGLYLPESTGKYTDPQLIKIQDNDIVNNAYFAVRNDGTAPPGEVAGNYYGGVPGEAGDRLEGLVGGGYRADPNDPETPSIKSSITVIDAGESVTLDSDTTLTTSYFVRQGGRLEIDSARVDLDGHWLAAKVGAQLEVDSATLTNGLTLAVATDNATVESTTFEQMVAGVSVYMAAPYLANLTVRSQNTSYDDHGSSSARPRYILEPSGLYLYRDATRVETASLTTAGRFGVFGWQSRATLEGVDIADKNWGVGAAGGALRLVDCSIARSLATGITGSDGLFWYYSNLSLTVEGCTFQDNPVGIELKKGYWDDALPHDIYIANTTISGGDTGLSAELERGLLSGNEFRDNGVSLNGQRLRLEGNTFADGSGLFLYGERLRLENNTFTRNDRGLYVYDSAPILVNNDFTDNQYGVYAEHRGQPKLHYNNFAGNSEYGVYNDDTSTLVNASHNWWGDASGPSGEGPGSGDAVSKAVAYDPWLTSESDHQGHYQNLPPERPSLNLPATATLSFAVQGRAHDLEGDLIRRVEVRLANETYDSGWVEAQGLWRDVKVWSGYAHLFDGLGLSGDYTVTARAFDGNDDSAPVNTSIIVEAPVLESRGPLHITGDSGFTPANGVRGGSGTASDPFIIERWNISSADADAISLADTSAHVIIRLNNLYYEGEADAEYDGIALSNATNVTVEQSRFSANRYQIWAEQGTRAAIKESLFLNAASDEVSTRESFVEVAGSLFYGERRAILMVANEQGNGSLTDSIVIATSSYGGVDIENMDAVVAHNIILGGGVAGGTSGDLELDFEISRNVLSGGTAGVWFNRAGPRIFANLISDNVWGVFGDRSAISMWNNNLFGSERYGVENRDGSATIDARSNWWGAANGPSGAGDGDGDAVSDNVDYDPWLTEPVEPGANRPPALELLEPDGSDDEADTNYTVVWSASDPDGDDLTLDLYYDNDTNPDNGTTLITAGLADTGSYAWNTSAVAEGDYYVYGVADDNNGSWAAAYSPGTLHIAHEGEPENSPPSLEITLPAEAGEAADEAYTLQWQASDPDGEELTLDLYYDEDTDPDNGLTPIVEGLADTGSYQWDTSAVEAGEYYLYGVASDPHGASANDYSAGTVTVSHSPDNRAPQITLTTPAEAGELADENYLIQWQASDPDGDELTLNLYYDKDTDPDNGLTPIVEELADTGSYDWDTSGVEEGDYYLYAVADDGEATAAVYSDYSLAVRHPAPANRPPTLQVTAPNAGQVLDQWVMVRWVATDPDDGPLEVALAYMAQGAMTPQPLAGSLRPRDSYVWQTNSLAEGAYTLVATASDGEFTVWANVSVVVDHPDPARLEFVPNSFILDPARPREGETVAFILSLRNLGEAEGAATVEFYLDDESTPFYSSPVQIAADDSTSAFGLWEAQAGSHTLEARMVVEGQVVDSLFRPVEVAAHPLAEESEEGASLWWVWAGLLGTAGVAGLGVAYSRRRRNGNTTGVGLPPGLEGVSPAPVAPAPAPPGPESPPATGEWEVEW